MKKVHLDSHPAAAVVRAAFCVSSRPARRPSRGHALALATLVALTGLFSGCVTAEPTPLAQIPPEPSTQLLHAGDVLKISFPRAPSLDITQQIRRDGKINLYLIGEVQAAELAPAELEKQLVAKYDEQLLSKEVRVTVVSSVFAVYVTGAVLRPGRITPDRELTAIEAVMEAGGFDPAKASMKSVSVIRREGTETKNFLLNLQAVLDGKESDRFYLKANDIIYVPERRSIF